MINVELDRERKSQTVFGRTHARVKERAADSADHIKVSDVTYQGLAGVSAYMCILMCVLFQGDYEPERKGIW